MDRRTRTSRARRGRCGRVATRAGQNRFTSQTVPPRLAGIEVDPRSAGGVGARVTRRTRQIPINMAATGCGMLADDLLELAEEENVLPQLGLDPVFFQLKDFATI